MKQRILLTGKDGIDLLHRITTLDFARLKPGNPHPGLILNPQGKILCYFEAEKKNLPDQIELSFAGAFLELMDQYTFGERYKIEKLEPILEVSDSATELNRIRSKIPKLGYEFFNNGETNPLEINFKEAIHDQKGCYPGQEVIEKIIAIGSPSKVLCLVKCTEGKSENIKVPLDFDHGKLTSFESLYGLAIVRKTCAKSGTLLKSNDLTFEVI